MKPTNPYPILAVAVLAFAASLTISLGASPAYMELSIDGETVEGGSTDEGREGDIIVLAVEHLVSSPSDASGNPTGKIQHRSLKVTKRLDKSTPLLMQALVDNSTVEVTLKFYGPDPDSGGELHYYTIELTGAQITSARLWKPSTLDPAAADVPELMEFQIAYHTIVWTAENGGPTATDSTRDDA